jgi:hypothetical protein
MSGGGLFNDTPNLVMPVLNGTHLVTPELFTRRYSLHFFRTSVMFRPKEEGRIPYVPLPPMVSHLHEVFPPFENTPSVLVSTDSFTRVLEPSCFNG